MKGHLWLWTAAAAVLALAAWVTFYLDIRYLPAALMLFAVIVVIGVSMSFEDILLRKYDTPHDEDAHPPVLIAWRAVRALVVIAMAALIFMMV